MLNKDALSKPDIQIKIDHSVLITLQNTMATHRLMGPETSPITITVI